MREETLVIAISYYYWNCENRMVYAVKYKNMEGNGYGF